MKNAVVLLLAALMLLSLAACGAKSDTPDAAEMPGDKMTLSEIFDSILTDVPNLPSVMDIAVTDDNFESYLFIPPVEDAEALVSEAMINAVAHSAALLRVPEGTDAQALAAQIKENANPRKWICVEAEKTVVSVHGNTILLVMSAESTADAVAANFDALWK